MNNFWDKLAKSYTKNTEKAFGEANNRVINETKKYCAKSMNVLDIGCGTGLIIKDIAPFVSGVKAIDTSPEMIKEAKKNEIDNIEWETADLFSLNQEEHYSMVTAFNVLLYLDGVERVMQKIYSLLDQGGYFISVTDCLGEKRTFLSKLQSIGIKLGFFPKMTEFRITELKEIVKGNGFTIVYEENVARKTNNYLIIAKKQKRN